MDAGFANIEKDLKHKLDTWAKVGDPGGLLTDLCGLMDGERLVDLAFAQRFISEYRPNLYFPIARLFIEARILQLR